MVQLVSQHLAATVEDAADLSGYDHPHPFLTLQNTFPPGAMSCMPTVCYSRFPLQSYPFLSEASQEMLAFFRALVGKGEGRGSVRDCVGARRQGGTSLREMLLKMPWSWDPQKSSEIRYDENDENENTIHSEIFLFFFQ